MRTGILHNNWYRFLTADQLEFLKIATEELSKADEWSAEEKAYLLGRLAYEVVTVLIPGGVIAKGGLKAAKGAKFAQLIAKISKSDKIAKLQKSLPAGSEVRKLFREFWIDEFGAIPDPLNFHEGRKNLKKLQQAQFDELVGNGYPPESVIRHVTGNSVLPYDILPYKVGRFSRGLPGHEVLNNRFLELRGLAPRRGVGTASTQNPAIALPRDLHASTIQKLQRKHGVWFAKDLVKLTRVQIIKKNLDVLREAGVSEKVVQQIRRAVLIHARRIGRGS